MRTVIEVGRKNAPTVSFGLSEARGRLDGFGVLLQDLAHARTPQRREAMLARCNQWVSEMAQSLMGACDAWNRLDATLGDYKYNFRRSKRNLPQDLPGQQIMEFSGNA